MAETTPERVARLLAMVSYLSEHDEVPVPRLAAHFGVSEAQVRRDVETLWLSGTPGYQHGDLIDFSVDAYDDSRVALVDPRGMERPLRLGPGEAVALVVALRALAAMPGMADDVVTAALAKLTHAAGEAAAAADAVTIAAPAAASAPRVQHAMARARQALNERRRLALRYVAASDEMSDRVVEPLALLSDGDHWYLRAFCCRAQDVRHFRLDRVVEAEVRAERCEREREQGAVPPRPRGPHEVILTLSPRSRWVAERYGGDILSEPQEQPASPSAAAGSAAGPTAGSAAGTAAETAAQQPPAPLDVGQPAHRPHLRVRLAIADPAWLDALALELGPDLYAIAPEEHAERIAAAAERALAAYEVLQLDAEAP